MSIPPPSPRPLLWPLLLGGAAALLTVAGCASVEFHAPELDASDATACELVSEATLVGFGLDPNSESPGTDDTGQQGADSSSSCGWHVHEAILMEGRESIQTLIVILIPDGGTSELRGQARQSEQEIEYLLGYPAVLGGWSAYFALSSGSGFVSLRTTGSFTLAREVPEAILNDAIATLPTLD